MKTNHLFYMLAVSLLMTGKLFGQYSIEHSVFGGGGGILSNGSYTLSCTIAQPIVGASENNYVSIFFGFWYTVQPGIATSVDQIDNTIPREFRLEQNYPNPFNPSTTIQFSIAEGSRVTLRVFDLLGREVIKLVDDEYSPGVYTVTLDAAGLSSGMYIYRIEAGSFVQTKRLVLLK
jgi:hypothetical protein